MTDVATQIEWLDTLPDRWSEIRARYLFAEVDDRSTTGTEELLSLTRDRGLVRRSELTADAHNAATKVGYKRIAPGDIAMNKMQAWNGIFGLADQPGIISPDYTVFRPRREMDRRFYAYLLRTKHYASIFHTRARGMGTAFLRLNTGDFNDVFMPHPPLEEQQIIAAYLDRETGGIDALVERLERLIKLLAEKRQAVISHAVTKGLNPDAPMKDSDIDWLGEVPAHWAVMRLKHIVVPKGIQIGPFGQFLKEHTVAASQTKLIGQENVLSNDFSKGDRWIADDQFEGVPQYWVVAGDILFTRKGSIGKCSIVPTSVGRAIIDSDTIRVRLSDDLATTEFVRLALTQSTMAEVQTRLNARGAILRGVNSETLGNMVICLPPLDEQISLLAGLNQELTGFDAAIGQVNGMIATSKERRSALISAAVTGQIQLVDMVANARQEATE